MFLSWKVPGVFNFQLKMPMPRTSKRGIAAISNHVRRTIGMIYARTAEFATMENLVQFAETGYHRSGKRSQAHTTRTVPAGPPLTMLVPIALFLAALILGSCLKGL